MQKTATKAKSSSSYARPVLQKSTTLSRKYVRKPARISDVKKTNLAKAPVKTASANTTSAKVASAKVAKSPASGAAKKIPVAKAETKVPVSAKDASSVAKIAASAKSPVAKAPVEKAVAEKKDSPKVAFKTKAKAAELSEAISVSVKGAPIKKTQVERAPSIRRFEEPKVYTKAKSSPEVKSCPEAKVCPEAKARPVAKARSEAKKVESVKATKTAKAAKVSKIKTPKVSKAKATETDAARAAMRGLATMESTKPMKKHRGRRIALALGCSAIVVAALAVFVVLNMPNISVKIASAQTGIDATYPAFVPRNYSLETVASDKSGKITMRFVGPDDAAFVLTEEKSTWDSTAVLNNYVKTTYSPNYSTMHEQGITYYTEHGSAVWVNGGILYKISSYGKNLSKEQIRNLVVSL